MKKVLSGERCGSDKLHPEQVLSSSHFRCQTLPSMPIRPSS